MCPTVTLNNSCLFILLPCHQVEVERVLPHFKGQGCEQDLHDVLCTSLRLHSEMAHITTNLHYYVNLEVVECECCELVRGLDGAGANEKDCHSPHTHLLALS